MKIPPEEYIGIGDVRLHIYDNGDETVKCDVFTSREDYELVDYWCGGLEVNLEIRNTRQTLPTPTAEPALTPAVLTATPELTPTKDSPKDNIP